MRDNRFGDLDVGAHDDGAGAFVDDDLGLGIGFHGQLFHAGDEPRNLVEVTLFLGEVDRNHTGVLGHGRGAGGAVDGLGDAPRGREVRLTQGQLQHAVMEEGCVLPSAQQGAFRDGGGGGDALLDRLAAARITSCAEAADRHGPLCQGVEFAIGVEQRGHQEHAAFERLGITQGGEGHIHAVALLVEGAGGGRHHHGRDILALDVADPQGEIEVLQQVGHGLAAERDILIARAG